MERLRVEDGRSLRPFEPPAQHVIDCALAETQSCSTPSAPLTAAT
ncbi:hypothetical protein [Blastococcus brunescens]|uniref:Uncharacterized protein n=1 Tax=Blastococcus brunescens TaxID=1564165 RepID=A0ABZ1B505_9ACTN|nr:hypothetical protein [Blastococcus sp. BMG 8361]WRL65893.1 hypothetical protein U6N30_10240 [Blastococcus sp. BMG 8361]